MDIGIGAVIAGYRIEELIGRGGMGVVYRATESRPRRDVAVKIVAPDLAGDVRFRERFLRESEVAASIEHPHVVPVLRVGEENGTLFIAMRFIPSRDLGALIRAEGALEPVRAARIVDQIADALDCAHERGLVHRDVKPANILVEFRPRGEQAYLTDFGLTKHASSIGRSTGTGMMVGTIDYMAPEQLRGEPVDVRADIYSLGCVLFEALTGRVPYRRDQPQAVMYAHLDAPVPRVSDVVAGVSPGFDEVVARALAKNPDERYLSAGDLGLAATAAAEGRSVSVPERTVAAGEAAPRGELVEGPARDAEMPPRRELSPPRWSRRKLALTAGGPSCVAVLAVLLLLGVFSSSSNANTRAAEQTLGLANSATGLTNQLSGLAGQLRGNPSPSQRQQVLTKLAANHSAVTMLRAQANHQLASNPGVASPIRQAITIVVVVGNDVDTAGSGLTYVVRNPNSPTSSNRLNDATRRAQDAQQQAQQLPALLKPYLPSTPATTAPKPYLPSTPATTAPKVAAGCPDETIGGVTLRFVLHGNVSCNEAHQTMGAYERAIGAGRCPRSAACDQVVFAGGWTCSSAGTANRELIAGCDVGYQLSGPIVEVYKVTAPAGSPPNH
jgi:hypothetical protein